MWLLAFARVYRNHEQLDAERSFYGLVYRVLRRLCFNHLRDTKNRAAKLEEQGAWLMDEARSRQSDSDTTRRAELNELRSLLGAAIQALTANEREVFVLKEFDGLRYREISDLLDLPIGTVMSRLYAARRSLAKSLGDGP
jgi:RNA polymerase sigma-70 factor (ECF subfamily)